MDPKRSKRRPPPSRHAGPAPGPSRVGGRPAGRGSLVPRVPANEATAAAYSDHRLLDARSLALHAAIARKITRDPGLLEIPRRNVERWRARYDGPAPACLDEWRRILARPWAEVAALLTSRSEDAVRLRQSSPFAGILTASERKRIYDSFRA